MNAVNGLEKPELTCISEEGIADMDLPDNLLDDFDFNNDDNDDEVITSCNKVGKFLLQNISLSKLTFFSTG